MTPRLATSLRPGQFRHLIHVASATGRLPERDVMSLWLAHTTGIRVTELALLEVADVLYSVQCRQWRSDRPSGIGGLRHRQSLRKALKRLSK
ncbi:hypothetical protein EC837_0536 [Pseudomonas protegens]|nr:hypothetical protein EC837_0536 [Pseudomonas protegens]